MAYNKSSIETLTERAKQSLAEEMNLNADLIEEGSLTLIVSKVLGGMFSELYSTVEYKTDQALPNRAAEEGLREWGSVKDIDYLTSRVATGSIDVLGTNGSTIAAGLQLTYTDGTEYEVTTLATIAGGTASVAVTSVTGGEDKNRENGDILTFISTPAGVADTGAVDSSGLTGGTDAYTLAEYKARLLDEFAKPARGGSKADYIRWTQEVIAATEVYPYSFASWPAVIAEGDVEIYFVMYDDDHANGIPTAPERAAVLAYIDDDRKPEGMGTLTVPALTEQTVAMSIKLEPNNADTEAAVTSNLEKLFQSTAPGDTLTTGKINRAISDAEGVEDFELTSTGTLAATGRDYLLTVGVLTITTL